MPLQRQVAANGGVERRRKRAARFPRMSTPATATELRCGVWRSNKRRAKTATPRLSVEAGFLDVLRDQAFHSLLNAPLAPT